MFDEYMIVINGKQLSIHVGSKNNLCSGHNLWLFIFSVVIEQP